MIILLRCYILLTEKIETCKLAGKQTKEALFQADKFRNILQGDGYTHLHTNKHTYTTQTQVGDGYTHLHTNKHTYATQTQVGDGYTHLHSNKHTYAKAHKGMPSSTQEKHTYSHNRES